MRSNNCQSSAAPEKKLAAVEPDVLVAGDGPVVTKGSHVTMHYSVTLADEDQLVVSTFGSKPATISPGYGQLAEALEACLIGQTEGSHMVFHLAAGQAYGERNPELIQALSRETLQKNTQEQSFAIGDLVEFPAPQGGSFAGVLKELDNQRAVFDFNHPLAGRPIRFEVKIIGVL